MRSKRRRIQVVEDDGELDADNRSSSSDDSYEEIYPCIWGKGRHKDNEPNLDPASQCLPAFKSSLEIYYTKLARRDDDSWAADRAAKKLGWLKEEEDLLSLFSAFCPGRFQPQTFDLGQFWVQDYNLRDAGIPFFYGNLRPAPPLPQGVAYESLQPEDLLPALCSSNSIASSGYSNAKESQEGSVVPYDPSQSHLVMPPFWEMISLRGQKQFFNTLTVAVSPSLPDDNTALKGILAEEPGLGETIECISFILMNPAPDLNPINKRWDAEAKLEALNRLLSIATPPPLAPQWTDELAAHAPGLKVLVHEGWSKVDVPITLDDVENDGAMSISPKVDRMEVDLKNANGKSRVIDEEDAMVIDEEWTSTGKDDGILVWCSYVNTFDVCITTYNVFRQIEFGPPDGLQNESRPIPPPIKAELINQLALAGIRRADVEYSNLDRPRSPPVMCEWYRVLMDVVQMMWTAKSE
ncbi:hypothetical protein AZE42_10364 [Rhizopogon vesiculosus]|uniref:SNF2 N-terminal domain-containing protein n=1 Tax=Rhizopogon vesiculosus TaxID=180088 RepID=A0A1J8QUY0_9AGAM|nr:hypothetical protein AZE42_10364 [Rhizopogon vesiculosus]